MKIVVGGALYKKENAELIEKYGNGKVEVEIMPDPAGGNGIKSRQSRLLSRFLPDGRGRCSGYGYRYEWHGEMHYSGYGGKRYWMKRNLKAVKEGKKAFGFVPEAAAQVIPVIMKGILENE